MASRKHASSGPGCAQRAKTVQGGTPPVARRVIEGNQGALLARTTANKKNPPLSHVVSRDRRDQSFRKLR